MATAPLDLVAPGGEPGREKMNIVVVGHVDHGKSTLVGRLLADSGSLPVGKLEHVQAICKRQGKRFEYAFLLDALEAEQEQGITIDSARCFFKTARRDYIIIDAPGHIEFLKNMISGAARAEAAVLLIDAQEGVRENSRRHGYVLSMLSIRQVVVAVNKMDLVGYDPAVFRRIEAEYRAYLAECGLEPQCFIPISARDGDQIARKGGPMPWYDGPTILEQIDRFEKAPPTALQPLRLPIQDVYKFNERGDDRRIIVGRLESGTVSVGDRVVFHPSNKSTRVHSIEAFNLDPLPTTLGAPHSVGITLTEQIFVQRGEVASHVENVPCVSTRFRANLIWLGREPMVSGQTYKLKLATAEVPCRIHKLEAVIDASELGRATGKQEISRHDVADVVLETRRPVAFDPVHAFQATGRFVIVEGYDVRGGGIIREPVADDYDAARTEARHRDFAWRSGLVTPNERATRFSQRPGLVLFIGAAGSGKAMIAHEVERLLFDGGYVVYLLDAENVLLGVDRDERDRAEMVRKYAEVANLFLDAGHLVISTSNTFGLADHGIITTLVAPDPVLLVHCGDDAVKADLILPSGGEPSGCALRVKRAMVDTGLIRPRFSLGSL
jgi:bifunctional enzyme CysN/CysC